MNKIIIGDATFYHGDCLDTLKSLEDESVNCCVTSPPYFGLRDYGNDKQIGLEQNPNDYVQKLVSVFQEVKRILKKDGTLWLNLGDSYASGKGSCFNPGGGENSFPGHGNLKNQAQYNIKRLNKSDLDAFGVKPKDLMGIPWRVAFALQDDGWYLRQDIIWHKPNPMPESVKDRCTKAHEYLFLLSKSSRYYFNNDAIKEECDEDKAISRKKKSVFGGRNKHKGYKTRLHSGREYLGMEDNKRNKRSVWTIPTQPFKGPHFAVFPGALVEPCILAGCPENGVVLDPFGGSGTTAIIANKQRRKSIICELNSDYLEMAVERYKNEVKQLRLEMTTETKKQVLFEQKDIKLVNNHVDNPELSTE